jgi:hypothetical protein
VTATTRTTTTRVTTRRPTLRAQPARYGKAPAVLVSLIALALAMPAVTGASDRTLKRTVAHWSHTVALDARGISLSASRRHPRRMMLRAREFRADSVRAVRAIGAQRATTARGRRAKRLALSAFRAYAVVGAEWARSGQARLQGRRTAASRHAARAQRYARIGNRLIRSAGRLLR